MSGPVVEAPTQKVTDAVSDNTNFNTEQTAADTRHTELLCKLDELNNNLSKLVTYFALITGQTISKDDK